MQGISVIICCYNSGEKLIPSLTHLAKQQLINDVNYELIIVDNNCTDNTIEIALNTWNSLPAAFPLVLVKQPKAGLSYARASGINEAKYEYLIFCDDDNWLCQDYLYKVYSLFETNPDVAITGGTGQAVSGTPLPDWFNKLQGFGYAVGAEGRQTGYVDSVYGAGMALRKSIFYKVTKSNFSFILSDRKGKKLSSGGDTEICMLVRNAGYKIYFDDSLTFKHYLSNDRLQWRYYLKLRRSFGKSSAHLLMADINSNTTSLHHKSFLKQFLSLFKFALLHFNYFFFPAFIKSATCANFIQELSMRTAFLFENKKYLSEHIVHNKMKLLQKDVIQKCV